MVFFALPAEALIGMRILHHIIITRGPSFKGMRPAPTAVRCVRCVVVVSGVNTSMEWKSLTRRSSPIFPKKTNKLIYARHLGSGYSLVLASHGFQYQGRQFQVDSP